MNKTLTIIRPGETHDDYSWALKLSDAERLSIADQLLRDLWIAAHGQPYPLMDRTVVRLVKEKRSKNERENSIGENENSMWGDVVCHQGK